MIEALCRPGRDPREDLPPPIFRKDVVKFEDLQAGMELRGTVLNVVDFGAFVDVGLSDSGLIHISQLSAGYVRDPHDVVAVGDQVRAWVSSIDKERRRVALTMIAAGHRAAEATTDRAAAVAAADRTAHSKRSSRKRTPAEGAPTRADRRPRSAAATPQPASRATTVAARRNASRAPALTKSELRNNWSRLRRRWRKAKISALLRRPAAVQEEERTRGETDRSQANNRSRPQSNGTS